MPAFRADTGERVWTTDTQAGIVGGSVSYTVDGVQYVAVTSGFGSLATMRHHFRVRLAVSPSDYRKRFAVKPAGSVLSPLR